MSPDPVHVLLADDHPVYRDGLAGLLGATTDLVVVGQAGTGREAVELAASLTPDVVVLDLNMPELNGVDAARQIVGTAPHTAVLILTMYDDDALVFQALQAGARGYLLKSADPDTKTPGGRAGQFMIVRFETQSEKGGPVIELVAIEADHDGQLRVGGYGIATESPPKR